MIGVDVQEEDELLCMASRRSRLMLSIFGLSDIRDAASMSSGSVRLLHFRREDIHTLVDLVVWPSAMCSADGSLVRPRGRYVFTKEEALCVLFGRLATPQHWCEMESILFRSSSALSEIFYVTLNVFHSQFGSKICPCWNLGISFNSFIL